MCRFLWDTPLLMICQIVHTADFMFCETPDTLTATEYDSDRSSVIYLMLSQGCLYSTLK